MYEKYAFVASYNRIFIVKLGKNISAMSDNLVIVWFICLKAYQSLMGYLMLKFDNFVNVWLQS